MTNTHCFKTLSNIYTDKHIKNIAIPLTFVTARTILQFHQPLLESISSLYKKITLVLLTKNKHMSRTKYLSIKIVISKLAAGKLKPTQT